jgi:UDP-GlcNAc:undecaprenyl-phosphate GlcNAc-1-phosphate transferase
MEQIIIGGVISFLATFLAIPIVLRVAEEKKLYDLPDDDRKLHKKPIASLGGIGIFIGFIISILLSSIVADKPEFSYFMAAATLIFFIGLKDDLINLSAKTKFFAQLVISAILIFKGGLLINNMYGFLGIYELPQTISYFITFSRI